MTLRGQDQAPLKIARALLIGVGVGIGMVFAPARGQKTRGDIAEKVRDFRDKVRSRSSGEPRGLTGTYGE